MACLKLRVEKVAFTGFELTLHTSVGRDPLNHPGDGPFMLVFILFLTIPAGYAYRLYFHLPIKGPYWFLLCKKSPRGESSELDYSHRASLFIASTPFRLAPRFRFRFVFVRSCFRLAWFPGFFYWIGYFSFRFLGELFWFFVSQFVPRDGFLYSLFNLNTYTRKIHTCSMIRLVRQGLVVRLCAT